MWRCPGRTPQAAARLALLLRTAACLRARFIAGDNGDADAPLVCLAAAARPHATSRSLTRCSDATILYSAPYSASPRLGAQAAVVASRKDDPTRLQACEGHFCKIHGIQTA
jgi:hypothetical protein